MRYCIKIFVIAGLLVSAECSAIDRFRDRISAGLHNLAAWASHLFQQEQQPAQQSVVVGGSGKNPIILLDDTPPPSPEPERKRKRHTSESTQDSLYSSAGSSGEEKIFRAKRSQKIPVTEIIALRQSDGWQCGYYAVFHYRYLSMLAKNPQIPKPTLEDFDSFIGEIADIQASEGLSFSAKRTTGEWLGEKDIKILSDYIKQKSPQCAKDSVIVVESQDLNGIAPKSIPLAEDLYRIQNDATQPHWILLVDAKHWICIEINPGKKVSLINSIKNYPAPQLQDLLKLATGEILLPLAGEYSKFTHDINQALRGNPSEQEKIKELREKWLAKKYNPGLFEDLLADKRKANTSRDNVDIVELSSDDDYDGK